MFICVEFLKIFPQPKKLSNSPQLVCLRTVRRSKSRWKLEQGWKEYFCKGSNTLSGLLLSVFHLTFCAYEVNCTFLFEHISQHFPNTFAFFFRLVERLRDSLTSFFLLRDGRSSLSCVIMHLKCPHPKLHSSGKKWCCKFAYFAVELWLRSLIRETVAVKRKK